MNPKLKELLGRAVEVVTFLFAAFGGFLEEVAPPEEAGARFAVGLASFFALIILLGLSVLAQKRLTARRRRIWLIAAAALAVVAAVSGVLYQRNLEHLTFAYPPESGARAEHVAGTHTTARARQYADQGLGPGQILAKFGPENRNLVWPAEAIRDAKTILTVNYLILVIAIAGAVFGLVEVYLAAEQRRARARAGRPAESG